MKTATETHHIPFFVYGTLKTGFYNYERFLRGRTINEQDAWLSGAALYSNGRLPFMVLNGNLAEAHDLVSGHLMTIEPALYPATLGTLDLLEGYVPGSFANYYHRVRVLVQVGAHSTMAWTYLAGPRILAQIRSGALRKVPNGEWLAEAVVS